MKNYKKKCKTRFIRGKITENYFIYIYKTKNENRM